MATVTRRSEVLREINDTFGQIPKWVESMPDSVIGGFWSLMRDFHLAETKIPNKYKELIGIAVSGATRCKYCQLFHTEAARLNGATDDEIAEAAAMAGVTMLGSTYLNAMAPNYGSAFGVQTRLAKDRVVLTGRSSTYVRVGDEGGRISFHFCPECGATVYYFIDGMPESIVVPVGAFADPNLPSPVFSVYEARRHTWVQIPESVTEHWD